VLFLRPLIQRFLQAALDDIIATLTAERSSIANGMVSY
jgi:hypothetical protein